VRRITGMRAVLLAAVVALLAVPSAAAKDFEPGDVRLCNGSRCVAIMDPAAITALGHFYYSSGEAPRACPVPLGARAYELKFRNAYTTGIVAGQQLDRFLSYGVHLERFFRDRWYRVPDAVAAELRRLAAGLEPLRVTPARLARSR
jgi:hypothetical protein